MVIMTGCNEVVGKRKMSGNKYVVTYYRDKGAKKTYHFQLEKNNKTKNLKLTWDSM